MSAQQQTSFQAAEQQLNAVEYIVRVLECGAIVYEEQDDEFFLDL